MKRTPVIFLVFGVVVLAAFLALASHSSAAPADPPAVSVNGPQSPNACGTGAGGIGCDRRQNGAVGVDDGDGDVLHAQFVAILDAVGVER